MNSENRKAKKYQPFDSLKGLRESLILTEYEFDKEEKPFLSSDQLEEIDIKLIDCFTMDYLTKIVYYEDGYLKESTGLIKRIDVINKYVIFKNKKKIWFENIIGVESI